MQNGVTGSDVMQDEVAIRVNGVRQKGNRLRYVSRSVSVPACGPLR